MIKDLSGRVLNVQNAGRGTWEWAYFGAYDRYWKDVFPLQFSGNPVGAPASLVMPARNWPLHSNGTASSWEYALWASSNYGSDCPVIPLSARVTQTNPDGSGYYNLSWNNNGTVMKLCADSGSWNWAYGSAPSGGHAVNVFVDTSGTVRVIEPQNGQIVQGKDWKDAGGVPYSPYFILM